MKVSLENIAVVWYSGVVKGEVSKSSIRSSNSWCWGVFWSLEWESILEFLATLPPPDKVLHQRDWWVWNDVIAPLIMEIDLHPGKSNLKNSDAKTET